MTRPPQFHSQARSTRPARSMGSSLRVRPLILALCGAGFISAALAQSVTSTTMPNPVSTQNGVGPVAGTGAFNTDGSTEGKPVHNYSQTSTVAVWHFNSFSIGSAGTVNNSAPKASDLTVFRVIGTDRSELAGALNANNRLVLINRNGIHAFRGATFGGGGTLVASAHELDPSLMAKNYEELLKNPTYIKFTSNAGDFVPNGSYGGYGSYGSYGDATVDIDPGVNMVAGDGGSIFLVGDQVRNQGNLQANVGGSAGLIAAGSVEMQMDVGDSGFIKLVSYDKLASEADRGSVTRVAVNTGTIQAQDGQITLVQANQSNTNSFPEIMPSPDVVIPYTGSEGALNGAYNTGTIDARGVKGQGAVVMEVKGEGNAAVNSGTIDVSATNATARAGSIRMSGAMVLLGGDSPSEGQPQGTVARLVANGPAGGGTITLDNRSAPAGGESSRVIHATHASSIQANAAGEDAVGNGGNITMSTATITDGVVTGLDHFGQIIAHGQIQARGAGGGKGGTLTTVAPRISVRDGDADADISLGAGGQWRLVSNNVIIGSTFFSGEGVLGSFVHADDISKLLNDGTHVTLQAQHSGAEGSSFEEGFLYVDRGTTIERNAGSGDVDLTLESTNDLTVSGGTTINATTGRLNIKLNSDSDEGTAAHDGRGSLIIGERVTEQPSLTGREVAGAVLSPNPVVINTNGGNLVLSGAGRPPRSRSEDGLTNTAGTVLTNVSLNAGLGSINITGFGGSTGGESISQNGVVIDQANITGRSVGIEGESTSATGVSINDASITATEGSISVTGTSDIGDNDSQMVTQRIGVDIGDGVDMTTGQGGVRIQGLAVGGSAASAGLRIKSLKIVTTAAPQADVPPTLITLVGQSMQSTGAGLEAAGGGTGLVVEGVRQTPTGPAVTSAADIVIGANADQGAQALLLGGVAPNLNTSGRVNIRPMALERNGAGQRASALDSKDIHIFAGSASGSGTNFNIDSRWLGVPAAGGTTPAAKYVIGSNTHTGLITAGAGALNGVGILTLQNQGANAEGIRLAAQQGLRQLNLLSNGRIFQDEGSALDVDVLNILVGQNANVQLTNPGNRFGVLNFAGAQSLPNVTPAATTNSGEDDIVGFDTGAPDFQKFTISAVTNERPETEIEPEREVERNFEGTDMLNELRTDVYVHGQLSRPQLCTPANTAGGGAAVGDGGADALALEWTKVRRGPQLTNCAGMKADSNCSAF